MYALHDAGVAISALPAPQVAAGPTDQLERRAVEATERGSLTTQDRHSVMYSSTAAVLQLLESSARDYADMLAVFDDADDVATSGGPDAGAVAGQQVDVYA